MTIHHKVVSACLFLFVVWPETLDAFSVQSSSSSLEKGLRRRSCSTELRESDSSSSVSSGDASSGTKNSEVSNHVVFEYCTGCRWGTRSFWMAQELLTTFNDHDTLSSVTIMPNRESDGKFVVSHCTTTANAYDNNDERCGDVLWDRKTRGGFPEVKELKQLLRDRVAPALGLGHSDNKESQDGYPTTTQQQQQQENHSAASTSTEVLSQVLGQVKQPNVSIQYCTGCRWMLRSAYFGTELLATFDEEINSLTLIPSRPPEKGGIFTVTVHGETVWDRAEKGGFPETKELKQIVRDKLAPLKDLGHSDTAGRASKETNDGHNDDDEMDDDEAAELRAYYGVM